MKGSRAASAPSGPPEGSPEGVNLSLTGLPPPVSWRPNSASAAKPIARSFSAVSGSEPRRKALVSAGAGGVQGRRGLQLPDRSDLPKRSRPGSVAGLRQNRSHQPLGPSRSTSFRIWVLKKQGDLGWGEEISPRWP